jgi:phage gpG-like protein
MTTLELSFEFKNKRFGDAAAGLKAFSDELKKDWDGSAKVLSRELKEFLDQVAQALSSRHGGGWPGGTSADTLSKRSGALIDSILRSVTVTGQTFDAIRGTIGSDVPYAAIQEFGGTIVPKNSKYLCIPLPAALDSSGLPLQSSPRDWPNTFVARSKAGNLLIFQRRGTSIIPLYVLKSSVTIPPRLGLKKTLDAGLPYFVERAMDQMVAALNKGS